MEEVNIVQGACENGYKWIKEWKSNSGKGLRKAWTKMERRYADGSVARLFRRWWHLGAAGSPATAAEQVLLHVACSPATARDCGNPLPGALFRRRLRQLWSRDCGDDWKQAVRGCSVPVKPREVRRRARRRQAEYAKCFSRAIQYAELGGELVHVGEEEERSFGGGARWSKNLVEAAAESRQDGGALKLQSHRCGRDVRESGTVLYGRRPLSEAMIKAR